MPDPTTTALAEDLRAMLHTGLPTPHDITAPALLALPGVRCRASDPDNPASRARALDGLLRWQLARLVHDLAEPTRILFGASPTSTGTTLTERRTQAAQAADYEVHHFRKRIEPKICLLLADMLSADSEEFTATHTAPPALSQASGPLRLPADVFAWEAAEHERQLARLWSAVYALRAELLDVARAVSMDSPAADLQAATDTALWHYARLLAAADDYRDSYGNTLLHSDMPLAPRALARLAGWTPDLDPAADDRLSAAARTTTETDFLSRAHVRDREAWTAALTPATAGRTHL